MSLEFRRTLRLAALKAQKPNDALYGHLGAATLVRRAANLQVQAARLTLRAAREGKHGYKPGNFFAGALAVPVPKPLKRSPTQERDVDTAPKKEH